MPGIGNLADGANVSIYLAEGKHTDAAISSAAMLVGPVGSVAAGSRVFKTLNKGGSKITKALKERIVVKQAAKLSQEAVEQINHVFKVDGIEAGVELFERYTGNKIPKEFIDHLPPAEYFDKITVNKSKNGIRFHKSVPNTKSNAVEKAVRIEFEDGIGHYHVNNRGNIISESGEDLTKTYGKDASTKPDVHIEFNNLEPLKNLFKYET